MNELTRDIRSYRGRRRRAPEALGSLYKSCLEYRVDAMRNVHYFHKFWPAILIVVLVFLVDCDSENEMHWSDEEVGFRFGMVGDTTGIEDFVAVTTDEEIIETAREQLLLPIPEKTYHIHGLVAHGNEGHNLDWEWHFLASEWVLAEESTEVCDVNPQYIKAILDAMPDTLTSMPFCPLSSYVKAEVR